MLGSQDIFQDFIFFNLLTVSLRQMFLFLKRFASVAKRVGDRRNIAELMLNESKINARHVKMEAGLHITAS